MKRFVYFVCLVLGFSACSGSKNPGAETTSSSDQAAAPSVSTQEEEVAVERTPIELYPGGTFQQKYESYHHAYDVATGDPYADPTFEPLLELTTGSQKQADVEFITGMKERDEVRRFPEQSIDEHTLSDIDSDALIVDPNFVQFQDCHYTDVYVAKADSKERTESETWTFLYFVEMEFTDEEWHVQAVEEKANWEGKDGCAK